MPDEPLFRVHLPFPPSVNNLFSQGVVNGKQRRFPSRKYKAWRAEAVTILRVQRWPLFQVPASVLIVLTPPTSARRDADNYGKPIMDALVEARVLPDDCEHWVPRVQIAWDRSHTTPPGAVVTLVPLRPGQQYAVPEPTAPLPPQPKLSSSERKMLASLKKRGGYVTKSPNQAIPPSARSLAEKGLVRILPGLIDEAPQGFALTDAAA